MAGIFCPTCGRVITLSNLAISEGGTQVRCRACGTSLQWPTEDSPPIESTPMSPAPIPAPRRVNTFLIIALSVCVIASVMALAIVLARSAPQPTWDAQNHDKIIALKSEAESLAIEGKLAEAHAKYREMEKIIGGRMVKDPALMDMVEQARGDQDRIYAILLKAMEAQVAPPPAPQNPPQLEPYPKSFEPPQLETVQAPPTGPTTTAATRVASLPPTASQPVAATTPSDSTVSNEVTTPVADIYQNIPPGTVPPVTPVSDAEVEHAIRKGVDYLLTQFQNGVVNIGESSDAERAGIDALCVYSLLQCSQSIIDQRISVKGDFMKSALEKLKAMKIEASGQIDGPVTYARSLRAAALAVYDRAEDHKQIETDVKWLVDASFEGSYTYDDHYAKNAKRYNPGTEPRSRADLPNDAGPNVQQAFDRAGASIILCDGIHDPRTGRELMMPHNSQVGGHTGGVFGHGTSAPVPYPRGGNVTVTTPGSGYTGARLTLPGGRYLPSGPQSPILGQTLPGTFVPPKEYPIDVPWDNSNSQYGLLGVWAGAETGIEIPNDYWTSVERHWTDCQLSDGQWFYGPGDQAGRLSMTLAGIASLFVTHDYLDAPALGGKRGLSREPYGKALQLGLDYLETGDNSIDFMRPPLFYMGYNLFGLERVALASGMKHLGVHDWYAELAAKVLPMQFPSGAFGRGKGGKDDLIDTAYVLAFLVRGRHPVMMNKLRFNDFWTNRPREVANLSKDVSKELERPINWQVVDLLREPWEWADAPILYMASHHDVNFTDDEIGKLKKFIDNGGILFTHADNASEEFTRYVASLAKKMYPNYEFKDLPPDHPLYTINKTVKLPRPRLRAVSNGARLLMVHSPTDLSNAWQMRASLSRKEAFDVGGNLYVYATGKEQFRNRLDTPIVPEPPEVAAKKTSLARLKYAGNWDPEPGAWPRFAKRFQWLTSTKLEVAAIELKDLDAAKFPLAHLCGIDAFTPSDDQQKAMKKFVDAGGTLIIDTVGGSGKFTDSTTTWLASQFGNDALQPLDPASPILKGNSNGMSDISKPLLRLYAIEQIHNAPGRLKSIASGKGKVIVSSLDITSGLLGTCTWGILGYTPDYSESLAKNIVLSATP